jgi:MFS family permease
LTPRLILFITTVSAFCTSFAASSVNVALPLIGTEFHLGGVALNWVVTAFVLTSAVLIMPLGRLGDLYGRQRIFSWGMGVYLVGSLAGALAPDAFWLTASRAFTGIGAAMAFGTVTAVLVAAYPPQERGRVLGINVAMVYLGLSVGPVLGGLIVQAWGWRTLLFAHAGLSFLVVVLVFGGLRGNDKESHHEGFDGVGSLLYALGLAAVVIGVSNLPGAGAVVLIVSGLAVLGGFWWYESRAKSPILAVTHFTRNRVFAFSNLAAMVSYSATFAVVFFLSLYLQVVRGLSPAWAGTLLVVQPLVQAVFSPVTGRLSDRVSPRLLASTGMGLTALGLGGLSFVDATIPLGWVIADLILLGLGFALFSSPNTNAIMGSVEKRDLGLASATVATIRVIGQMVSMALALVLLSLILGSAEVTPQTADLFLVAQRWGFGLSAALCGLGIGASLARGSGGRVDQGA